MDRKKQKSGGDVLKYVVFYIKRYFWLFLLGIACLTLEALCDLQGPAIMSRIVDVGVKAKNLPYVLQTGGLMLAVTAVGAVAAVSRNFLATRVSQFFARDMRLDMFRKVQSFSFENVDRFNRASLVTRLTNDITQLQQVINGVMRIFVKAPITCIGGIVMMIVLNAPMALVLAAVLPVVAVLIYLSMRIGYPYFTKMQTAIDRMNAAIREYLSGIRVVKAFHRFDYEAKRFEGANEGLYVASRRGMRVMAVFSPCIALCVNAGIAVMLWIGGGKVMGGSVQVGQVMAFVNYMTQILMSLSMLGNIFTMFARGKASADRIAAVLDEENTMPRVENTVAPGEGEGVVFDHVSMRYPMAQQDALADISFSCLPGQTVGIIGSTGSGKSTLVNLIPRFYDVSAGRVLVGGADVREMDQTALREHIAIVPQKNLLFTGTIADNLRWGKQDATEKELTDASRAAQAHEFISSFPEGYETFLGQGGVNLSGGQKQRVSIARALVRQPKILILDDCTSAVDVNTELKIRQALRGFSAGLINLIISQRITSVMGADRILVMDEGRIVGQGTHEELMQTCGVYQDIFRSQIGKEEEVYGAER